MNKLISGTLLFVLFWSVFMWVLSITDDALLADVPATQNQVMAPEPQAMASLPRTIIEVDPADHLVAPAQLPTPMLRGGWESVGESTDDAPHQFNPQMPATAQDVDVPGDFPLSEQYWRDAFPEEAGLEPIGADDPMLERPELPDNPWGGEWGDRGGGG